MTAESLKPFLNTALPSGLNSQRRNTIVQIACFAFSALFVTAVVGLEIWNVHRISQLQTEVRTLKITLAGLNDKFGIDLYDEIKEFESNFDQPETPTLNELEGSGYYDDDEYDDFYEDIDDEDNESMEEPKLHRATRAVRSIHGIPIIDDSYAVRREQTHSPADAVVNNILLNKPPTVRPTMRYDWGKRQKRYHDQNEWNENEIRPLTSNIQTRGSRVMSTDPEDKSQAFRQVISKSEYSRWQEEMGGQRNEPQHIVRKQPVSPNMHKNLHNNNRVRSIAVHYAADEPSTTGEHSVNNVNWKASKWVDNLAMNRFFQLENGSVTVRKSGLYQVYAQITFKNQSSSNGFIVVHNAQRFLECQISNVSSNSCFTSRVVYLKSGDQIHLSDMFAHQSVVLNDGQSFFGLMKLGQGPQH